MSPPVAVSAGTLSTSPAQLLGALRLPRPRRARSAAPDTFVNCRTFPPPFCIIQTGGHVFVDVMAHNTTVQLGGVAFLVCKVAGVDRNQISWIRRRDWHILSSGAQMYTNDERFAILHTPGSNTWTLQIKFVQRRDHGTYECQRHTQLIQSTVHPPTHRRSMFYVISA
uniref:Ig-like domain-containing protein n=1 Tax=Anopheles coluzzii TaxID=1518534 RepID=A0A8W7Q086_ANOCL